MNCLIMINGLPVAAAVASALFTRRFRFIGVLARVGFRVLAIRVHTSTGKEKRSVAVARAAREVDRVRNPAPTFRKYQIMIVTFTGIGRFVRVTPTALGTI